MEIVGDGPLWPHLVELSAQMGLADRVMFRGRLSADGVRDAMARAHVLVLTSLYEGLSHTVLEAFAAGLPCIVSDRGGNEEVVKDARNGLVVPAQDAARLAHALYRLAADDAFRCRLAAAALDTVRAFDLADTVMSTERLLLNESGRELPDDTAQPARGRAKSALKEALIAVTHILFLSGGNGRNAISGAERHVITLVQELASRGVDTELVVSCSRTTSR